MIKNKILLIVCLTVVFAKTIAMQDVEVRMPGGLGQVFQVATVKDLKDAIYKEYKIPADRQKITFPGKVFKNDTDAVPGTIASITFDHPETIVRMALQPINVQLELPISAINVPDIVRKIFRMQVELENLRKKVKDNEAKEGKS